MDQKECRERVERLRHLHGVAFSRLASKAKVDHKKFREWYLGTSRNVSPEDIAALKEVLVAEEVAALEGKSRLQFAGYRSEAKKDVGYWRSRAVAAEALVRELEKKLGVL